MNIDWAGVFFAAFFGGLCLLVVFFANKEMEKDKDKIKDYCKKNGFTFDDNPESLLENYNNKYYTKDITKAFIQETAFLGIGNTFDIFSLGKYKRFSLGIMKQKGDMTIKIQDYFWCTKDINLHRRSSSVFWNYILCQIEVKSLDLPDFFIRSRGFSDKFSTDKNDVDINFDSNFSKKFIVLLYDFQFLSKLFCSFF